MERAIVCKLLQAPMLTIMNNDTFVEISHAFGTVKLRRLMPKEPAHLVYASLLLRLQTMPKALAFGCVAAVAPPVVQPPGPALPGL